MNLQGPFKFRNKSSNNWIPIRAHKYVINTKGLVFEHRPKCGLNLTRLRPLPKFGQISSLKTDCSAQG